MIQYHAQNFLGSKGCVTIMSEKNSSWERKIINFSHAFNIHVHVQYLWSDDFSNDWKLKFFKPVGGLHGQMSVLEFTQHEVITVLIVDFTWLKINQNLHLRICYGRDKTCYYLLKTSSPHFQLIRLQYRAYQRFHWTIKKWVYCGVNVTTWNITDCKDKYITAKKSNMYIPVSLSSSRSYHGNLQKIE